MPADDLVLNVRQIAGYNNGLSAEATDAVLIQRGGLGGPYLQLGADALVATALAEGSAPFMAGLAAPSDAAGPQIFTDGISMSTGGFIFWNAYRTQTADDAPFFAGSSAAFGVDPVAGFELHWAATAVEWGPAILTVSPTGLLAAQQIGLARDPAGPMEAATAQWVAATTVASFNGRGGRVTLWIDDIICAGGAPIYSPVFQGSPRAITPPPWSNSSRLATTAFVNCAIAGAYAAYAPLDSPNFTGVPTAPTPAQGSSDGQLATTAFVTNAVADSVVGVASFNTRTGAVVLTTADITGAGGAVLASPIFTGLPSAPTAAPGTNTTQLATTQFVQAAVSGVVAGVSSFNARTGAVVLTTSDISGAGGALLASTVASFNGRAGAVNLIANDVSAAGGALLASPAFTGSPTAPTPPPGDNSTRLATTAFIAAFTGFAPIASPAFTGVPTAPTASVGTNTTQLATTAFVLSEISASTAGVASFNGRTGAVTLLAADISGAGGALLASPVLTGTPAAPTAAPGVATTQLATCAFVAAALAAYAPLSSPAFTGAPTAPTAAPNTSTSQLATTAFVQTGVTDGSNAAAGMIGEVASVTRLIGAALGVLSGTATNIATLALTPGDWDVNANCFLSGATAGAVTALNFWLNTVSVTLPVPTANGAPNFALGVSGIANGSGGPTGRFRVNVAVATTVYLSAIVNFSSGTALLYGAITARRVR